MGASAGARIDMIAIDSEFESLIPPLTEDEYQRLERSILAEGVRDPIITWNGTIIDGHNRYRICEEHNIKFTTKEKDFESRDAAKIWIIENQFGRRNLSKYDRSVLALKLEGMYAEEAKKRQLSTLKQNATDVQKSAPREDTGKTRDKVAKAAGVSHDTIRKVKVIETEAAKGNPTAIKAREDIRTGKKSINKAHQSVHPNGDESDTRILCEVCGKPIDKGDSYDHDKKKHKACSYKLEKDRKRKEHKKPQFTEDGKRICFFCGRPIEDGKHYQDKLNWCYECGLNHATEMQRKYRDADRDLRENVPVYNLDSLVMELTASVTNMRDAVNQSIEINESMGVKLTSRQKDSLNKAIERVLQTIEKMKE